MTHSPGPAVNTPAGLAELLDDSTKGQALVKLPGGRLAVFTADAVELVRSPMFSHTRPSNTH